MVNQKAIDLIKGFEGLRLKAYQDIGGRWTIGFGSTGPGIEAGVEWSEEQALDRLEVDVATLTERIQQIVRSPVNDNQLAALISFAYNLGIHSLARSGLLRFLNLKQYEKAADQFLLWDKVGSYVSSGLSKRRQAERKVFLS